MDLAFTIIRLLLGLAIAAHGAQKLFGWFGGYGLAGTGGFFEQQLGFRPGKLFAAAAGAGEFGGGLLTILGLGGALGPALIVMVMVVAVLTVHIHNGFFVTNNGWELNLMYVLTAASVAYAGGGAYTLDSVLGLNVLNTPIQVSIALAAAVVVAVLNLAARRPVASKPPA
jgi:putative oxidoreductase